MNKDTPEKYFVEAALQVMNDIKTELSFASKADSIITVERTAQFTPPIKPISKKRLWLIKIVKWHEVIQKLASFNAIEIIKQHGDYADIKVNQPRFDELYTDFKKVPDQIATPTLRCGELQLNLDRHNWQYKNKPRKTLPDTDPIRLLVLLLRNEGKEVEYLEIAKELDLNCYSPSANNKTVSRTIQFIKRDLVAKLKEIGMKPEEVKALFGYHKNVGYTLHCPI